MYWDGLDSKKGYSGAKFQGFQSLAAAEAALVRGPPGALNHLVHTLCGCWPCVCAAVCTNFIVFTYLIIVIN